MIITREVEVKISGNNIKYFNNRGYVSDIGEIILVNVIDLPTRSHLEIEAQCCNCKEIKKMRYDTYLRNINSTVIHEYYCIHCKGVKMKKLAEIQQEKGLLKRGDSYYWSFEENRIKELKKYIELYGDIHIIDERDSKLYSAITEYDGKATVLAKKAGLNLDEIMNHKPYGYYDNLKNIIREVEEFIAEYDHFPTQIEMNNTMSLSTIHVYKHFKTIDDLRIYMGYDNSNDLVDNRGDINRSYYELYVANFLIAYGFKDMYKREQYPFKKYNKEIIYRSDFTLYLENNKELHVEVWGENGDETSPKYSYYKEKVKIKKRLYKKHSNDLILIEIYPKHLTCSYNKINENLYRIFNPYLKMDFKQVDYTLLISGKEFKDYELLDELMKYSKDNNFLPTREELFINEHGKNLYYIMMSKFSGFTYFFEKFNKKMRFKVNNYWDDIKVFEGFDYMRTEYNKILSYGEYKEKKDINLIGIYSFVQGNGGHTYYKFKYIQYLLDNKKEIPKDLVQFVNTAKKGFINGISNNFSNELQSLINDTYLLIQQIA